MKSQSSKSSLDVEPSHDSGDDVAVNIQNSNRFQSPLSMNQIPRDSIDLSANRLQAVKRIAEISGVQKPLKKIKVNDEYLESPSLASKSLQVRNFADEIAGMEEVNSQFSQETPQSESYDSGFKGVTLAFITKNLNQLIRNGKPVLPKQTGPNSPLINFGWLKSQLKRGLINNIILFLHA